MKRIAFLASSKMSSESIMRCYDWATEINRQDVEVESGFISWFEKDVLHLQYKQKNRIHHQHLISGRGTPWTAIGCKGSMLSDNQQIYFTNIWRSKKLDLYLRRQKR